MDNVHEHLKFVDWQQQSLKCPLKLGVIVLQMNTTPYTGTCPTHPYQF
jgi:hypothetical protein